MSYNSELQSNNTDLQSILDTINALPDHEEGIKLPALTNPGTALDLADGKELIDADGNVVAGCVRTIESDETYKVPQGHTITKTDENDLIFSSSVADLLIRSGAEIEQSRPLSNFGNATPNQVAKGATFTSASGLLVEGTHECEEGFELPTLDNPGSASDLARGKQLIGADGRIVEGAVTVIESDSSLQSASAIVEGSAYNVTMVAPISMDYLLRSGSYCKFGNSVSNFGNATAADVAKGKTFTSAAGFMVEGEAILPGGGSVYPEGAFAPVATFTNGKQYALVSLIGGVRRYINTTDYNQYTMTATEISIGEDAGDYVIFSATPALFTAVASGDGFLLQNGSNYLHGSTSNGTALRVGATQAVWTVDASATGGFSEGKYNAKEDANAVWLLNASGGYNWSVKYETDGGFGYDREGRDNTWSTGFTPFVLYEYVAGEGEVSPVVDTSDATATANDMASGATAYVNGRKIEGNVEVIPDETYFNSSSLSSRNDRNEIYAHFYPDRKMILQKDREYAFTSQVNESNFGNATEADVAAGKTFTSAAGVKITGKATIGNTGSTIKTGTTTSGTINTGLSEIEEFFLYKESVSATGLIHLHYSKTGGTSYLHASAWSTSMMGTKTITNGTTAATVNGGSITIPGTSATTGGLTSDVTYKWVAIGK